MALAAINLAADNAAIFGMTTSPSRSVAAGTETLSAVTPTATGCLTVSSMAFMSSSISSNWDRRPRPRTPAVTLTRIRTTA